jgi:ComF family protein
MVRAIPRHLSFDVVMPMPMHWRRQWRRGFNQAELLARPVARQYGIPLSHHLRRVRLGKVQAGLGAEARRENLKRAFQVKRAAEISGKKILLIDDVLTTGATLRAASAALKAAGAVEVVALTLARVPRQDTAGRLPGQYVEPGLTMSVASSEGAAARGGITDDGFGPTA